MANISVDYSLDKVLARPDYDPVRHLATAIFPYDATERLMVMIVDYTAYFDESYTHAPAPLVYTVAGCVSTAFEWMKFQKEWRNQLAQENIEYFHMVEFQACKPPYGDWSKEKRVKFLRSLHQTLHRRVFRSFATTVNLNDYESLTTEQKEVLGNPHVFAAKNCMTAIGYWRAESIMYNPLAYVLEQGFKNDKHLRRVFNEELREEDRNFFRIGSLTLADKKAMMPLQAADIYAYEAMKEIARQLTPDNKRGARESGKNLIRREYDLWRYCERTALVAAYEGALRRRIAYPDKSP